MSYVDKHPSARSSRPSDDQTFMDVACAVAQRSLCGRAQVGAVIISIDKIIVATGRNGPPRGFPHLEQRCVEWCSRARYTDWLFNSNGEDLPAWVVPTKNSDYSDCPSLHAEANALLSSERSQRVGGTIYVTTEVCYDCAKLIANSGLMCVVVQDDPPAYVARNAQRSYDLLTQCGVSSTRLGADRDSPNVS